MALLLSIVLVFTLFACSNNSNDDTSSLGDSTQSVGSDETGNNNGGNDKTNTGATNKDGSLKDPNKTGGSEEEGTTLPEPEPMPTMKDKVKKPTNDEGMPIDAAHLEKLRKALVSDRYTMSTITHANFEGMKLYLPVVFYKDGKKSAMKFEIGMSVFLGALDKELAKFASAFLTTIGGKNMKVSVISTPGGNYVLLDSLKKYQKVPKDEINDYMYSGTIINFEEAKYSGTGTVKLKGETYVCEEFVTDSGEVRTFYFLNGELKRVESKEATQTVIVEIIEIKDTVDSSVFKVPSNYTIIK